MSLNEPLTLTGWLPQPPGYNRVVVTFTRLGAVAFL